jgi:hypothetical protein
MLPRAIEPALTEYARTLRTRYTDEEIDALDWRDAVALALVTFRQIAEREHQDSLSCN